MEHRKMKLIHIDWDCPFKLSELDTITDKEIDYGIYQIYGSRSVYGSITYCILARQTDNRKEDFTGTQAIPTIYLCILVD